MPVVSAFAGLIGLASACLNPHPDDEPTAKTPSNPNVETPVDVLPGSNETCSDNPLLASCQANEGQTNTGSPGSGGAAGSGAAGSAGAGEGEMDAGTRDAGPVDATEERADAG